MTMYLATMDIDRQNTYKKWLEFNVGIFESREDAIKALHTRYNIECERGNGLNVIYGTIYTLEVGHTYIGGDYNRPEHVDVLQWRWNYAK